jgi:DNA adenine methylase
MILKWPGGKSKVLPQLQNLLPKDFNTYIEPFFGGGALFFYLRPKNGIINDVNESLMNLYSLVKEDPGTLIKELDKITSEHLKLDEEDRKKNYYVLREEFNATKNALRKSALFIFLNKTGFNGMYRENSKGEFNIPFGRYTNPRILNEDTIRKTSELLKDIDIRSGSYKSAVKSTKIGDFVYLDPPYHPMSSTSSFTSYSKDDFVEKDQIELSEVFRELDKKGCFVMLSNSNTPLIKELYKNYNIHEVQVARSINSKASGRSKISELVVTNYES